MKRTYATTYTALADREMGSVHLVYVDTIHSDGKIEWSVKGMSDGEYVNEKGVRQSELQVPVNFDVVRAARLSSGWRELP